MRQQAILTAMDIPFWVRRAPAAARPISCYSGYRLTLSDTAWAFLMPELKALPLPNEQLTLLETIANATRWPIEWCELPENHLHNATWVICFGQCKVTKHIKNTYTLETLLHDTHAKRAVWAILQPLVKPLAKP
ncbi:MAG: hypothetical protein A3J38_03275 [Gammaproteobacteria bacterium RIFCSPHIGHO2_12_FULL_45_9]|nr:MAG: hypothetical protein A3J38_03275 [Gammaproteobacteria bacterium RIFCSPHIGHO2_12_FULL_45_9]